MPTPEDFSSKDERGSLIEELRTATLVDGSAVRLTPLTGGVSSEIFLVEDGSRRFAVKRALARLRVKDDWFADVGRNRVEQQFLGYAGGVAPEAVPKVLHLSLIHISEPTR